MLPAQAQALQNRGSISARIQDIMRCMQRLLYLFLLLCFQEVHSETVIVAVASNLTHTVTQVSLAFNRDKGGQAALTFGSSGNFARQIVQGAPYEVFISAGKKYIDFIGNNGREISRIKGFAYGRLSLYIPETSKIKSPTTLGKALKSLQYGNFRKMAIANPEHAPYGSAAEEALKSAGLWAIKRDKLLLGENAAQAMQFCVSGSVDACIIPDSFLILKQFSRKGTSFLIPQTWHQPITQYIALLDEDDEASSLFFNYLLSDAAGHILKKHGYILPD